MDHAPQNTMASFLEAERQGADGLELDVQLSSDGKPFVFHDFTLENLTDGEGLLTDHCADALRRLTLTCGPIELGPEFDSDGENAGMSLSTRIPELDQVFKRFGNALLLNVEIKTPFMASLYVPGNIFPETLIESESEMDAGILAANRRYVEIIAERLLEYGTVQNQFHGLIISSFDPFALAHLHEMAPGIPLAFLSMPGTGNNFDALAENLLGNVLAAWHPHYNQVDEELVEYQHRKKRLVNVWTVNEAETARSLADLGVDSIITNSPARIRSALINN